MSQQAPRVMNFPRDSCIGLEWIKEWSYNCKLWFTLKFKPLYETGEKNLLEKT